MFGGEASGGARKEGDATAPDSATRSMDCSVALPRTLCADPHMRPMRALGHRGNRRFGLLCHGCIRRAPVDQPFAPVRSDTLYETDPMTASTRQAPRIYTGPQTPVPAVQLLSNGRYHLMLTSAGGGYSRWDALALTRWHDDATRDNHGSFVYLRDADSDALWSVAHQPTLQRGDCYEADFSGGRARFWRVDHGIETQTEIAVAADDVEVRRVHVTNRSDVSRTIELTSYAEVVLAPAPTDAAHQAFNKLFVQTEIVAEQRAILATHRASKPGDATPFLFHMLSPLQELEAEATYETDRAASIGRRVTLAPGATACFDWVTGISDTREASMALVEKYQQREHADGALLAPPSSPPACAAQTASDPADADAVMRLAASMIYSNASMRADAATLARNRLGQSGLWAYAISGDLPMLLLRVGAAGDTDLALARQLIDAHGCWRWYGLALDLVIVNAAPDAGALAARLTALIAECGAADLLDKPGGIFVRAADNIPAADYVLLQTVARAVVDDAAGTLARQLDRHVAAPLPQAMPQPLPVAPTVFELSAHPELEFDNGLGGFSTDGSEYVITLRAGQTTPAPWVNVLANPNFGTLISESGSATTWSENAQAFRLTPWSNDPVADANTEAFYLRDEDSGHYWSATASPSRGTGNYVTRHGFGYSVFEHIEDDIASELCVFVAIDAPVKYARLTLHNRSSRSRRLSATAYVEWVLGEQRDKTKMHVVTTLDGSGALIAENGYNSDFAGRAAFFDVDVVEGISHTGDRASFLGIDGSLRDPAAMSQPGLSDQVGAALDPCAALRVPVLLAPGASYEVIFRLGAEHSVEAARALALRSRGSDSASAALEKVKQYWTHTLGAVQVKTPNRAFDILTNGWVLYQVLACRLWARNAFYQSSGAFGFRDQLQDVMALVHAQPALMREHLLRCAGRQFPQGDVQHWWHPPQGRGVRTNCSDDYLWLPLATCRYVLTTGDSGVLDEVVNFIEGSLPKDGKDAYELPTESKESATLYQHCVRAIEHGLRFGAHGLPLMGSGDWNDGMNLVGAGGKGESVWLAFFLCRVLKEFGDLAASRDDAAFATRCREQQATLSTAIEQSAWDGDWYRRAWFDDGTVLGSAENTECRIDSIAQSWSVLSGVAEASRARQAMDALEQHLVRPDAAVVQLLDPPFDRAEPNPGYIKGYLPGVRENGGQYTHAAVWAGMAFAALGDAQRAWQLYDMLAPINHADTPEAVARYKTEPYVLASDVYAFDPHKGRGGWTWYTGSAGWMYRYSIESLLGLTLEGTQLRVAPCIPADWDGFELRYRYKETIYTIFVQQGQGVAAGITVDGKALDGSAITLFDDRRPHRVEIHIALQQQKESHPHE